jgi:hypothetical protein
MLTWRANLRHQQSVSHFNTKKENKKTTKRKLGGFQNKGF